MSTVGARLDHLHLLSPQPERLVDFYQGVMGMPAERVARDVWVCTAPERALLIERGASPALRFGAYRFESPDGLASMRRHLTRGGIATGPSPTPLLGGDAFSFADPDGNTLVFGHDLVASRTRANGQSRAPAGRLQHLVLASDEPEALARFYRDAVGLPVSDQVLHHGALMACWLRTDLEHHSLAVFRAGRPGLRLDHHSYEVRDWLVIRDWADHFAAHGVKLVWGPGRHGPGNNLFIMVHDPDGNLVEISAELEVIAGDRPAGTWPHEESTFNKWGSAALRT
ncbi:MAG TPA: VOC family protein [bacterium]|nr:VOC family protein [bacterium]